MLAARAVLQTVCRVANSLFAYGRHELQTRAIGRDAMHCVSTFCKNYSSRKASAGETLTALRAGNQIPNNIINAKRR